MRCHLHMSHHVGSLCPACGNDERRLGGRMNPNWPGYTVEEFLSRWGIRMTFRRVRRRADGQDWPRGSTHYECTLTREFPHGQPAAPLTVPFSIGPDLLGSHAGIGPSPAEVMLGLAREAHAHDRAPTLEQWAEAYEFDAQSGKDQRVFNTIAAQTASLRRFLGGAYSELMQDVQHDEAD